MHRIESLLDLSGVHDTELMAIGIGHYHPADLALTDVDARCPEVDETVDLPLLITVDAVERRRNAAGTSQSLASVADHPR